LGLFVLANAERPGVSRRHPTASGQISAGRKNSPHSIRGDLNERVVVFYDSAFVTFTTKTNQFK
jgi:hypothetical protein